jgi:hypothetical protein
MSGVEERFWFEVHKLADVLDPLGKVFNVGDHGVTDTQVIVTSYDNPPISVVLEIQPHDRVRMVTYDTSEAMTALLRAGVYVQVIE